MQDRQTSPVGRQVPPPFSGVPQLRGQVPGSRVVPTVVSAATAGVVSSMGGEVCAVVATVVKAKQWSGQVPSMASLFTLTQWSHA